MTQCLHRCFACGKPLADQEHWSCQEIRPWASFWLLCEHCIGLQWVHDWAFPWCKRKHGERPMVGHKMLALRCSEATRQLKKNRALRRRRGQELRRVRPPAMDEELADVWPRYRDALHPNPNQGDHQ